jgi:hypothetical protein
VESKPSADISFLISAIAPGVRDTGACVMVFIAAKIINISPGTESLPFAERNLTVHDRGKEFPIFALTDC